MYPLIQNVNIYQILCWYMSKLGTLFWLIVSFVIIQKTPDIVAINDEK